MSMEKEQCKFDHCKYYRSYEDNKCHIYRYISFCPNWNAARFDDEQ